MAHNIFTHSDFVACQEHAAKWEESHMHFYSEIMCLKDVGCSIRNDGLCEAFNNLKPFITNSVDDVINRKKSHACIRPKGHTGKCATGDSTAYIKKIINSKELLHKVSYLYITPGDDDYIYKNRSSRLFPIALSKAIESTIRNKNVKLKCAIPLSEASTPWMIATTYLDYMTLLLNVKDIEQFVNVDSDEYKELKTMTNVHKTTMMDYFANYNRKLFDVEGYTVCPIRGIHLHASYFTITDRVNENSIQLGHVIPRSENQYTIRGLNVLFMTRRGNAMLGDNSFIENKWIDNFKHTIMFHE